MVADSHRPQEPQQPPGGGVQGYDGRDCKVTYTKEDFWLNKLDCRQPGRGVITWISDHKYIIIEKKNVPKGEWKKLCRVRPAEEMPYWASREANTQ